MRREKKKKISLSRGTKKWIDNYACLRAFLLLKYTPINNNVILYFDAIDNFSPDYK